MVDDTKLLVQFLDSWLIADARIELRTSSTLVALLRVTGNLEVIPKCLQSHAGSEGRRNTGLEFTGRGFKAQSFSRALIQTQRYFVEFGLRINR